MLQAIMLRMWPSAIAGTFRAAPAVAKPVVQNTVYFLGLRGSLLISFSSRRHMPQPRGGTAVGAVLSPGVPSHLPRDKAGLSLGHVTHLAAPARLGHTLLLTR